jgi:hypothetical protein
MHESVVPEFDETEVTLKGLSARYGRLLFIGGIVVLGLAFILGWMKNDSLKYFYHAYLVSFCFYLSLSLGALFFVALQHASRAGWSIAVRRVSEILAANTLLMAILFLPILLPLLFGSTSLYEWLDAAKVTGDEVLEGKKPYLNLPFFTVRALIYFGIWGFLVWFFLQRSVQQDHSGDAGLSLKMEKLSYPALILFALTTTFAAFDWMMSLTPHWFSTIYGVYYFGGAVVGFLSLLILVLIALQSTGRLTSAVTVEHYHELGKFLFAFVVFWGYIAFSQYMLIWYANIPEETTWYLPRQQGSWTAVSIILLFGHLFIPFFGLMSRHVKRRKGILGFWALWLLIMHWLDIYYLVMPQAGTRGLPPGLIDVCSTLGMGLVFLAGALFFAGERSLVPIKDPRLGESLSFENI